MNLFHYEAMAKSKPPRRLNRIRTAITGGITILMIWWTSSFGSAQISEFRTTLDELKNSWDAEQVAIAKIKKLGGWVTLEDCVPAKWHNQIPKGRRKFVVKVNMVYHEPAGGGRLDNANLSDDCLEAIGKFTQVKKIYLKKSQASDDKLKHLADLKQVDTFFVWDADKITDQGLQHLRKYRKLENVHISNGHITSKGITWLTNSNSLKKLSLQGNGFSNDIIDVVARFKKLETLWVGLGDNTIDDKGLKELPKIKSLKTLGIQANLGTDAGLKALYQLPKLERIYISGASISKDEIEKLKAHVAQRAM